MAYLAPIHRPSGVSHALKLKFLSPDEECLAVAKANTLDLYIQIEGNLVLKHTRTIYGRITHLGSLRPANSLTDYLFIVTDRFMLFTVSWDNQQEQLRTEKTYPDQTDLTGRESIAQDQCVIDPTKQFMALQLYDGIVTIMPIIGKEGKIGLTEDGPLEDPVPVRIPDFFVRSFTFIHSNNKREKKPLLAFLHEDNLGQCSLSIRVLDYESGGLEGSSSIDLDEVKQIRDDLVPGASHLISVPAPAGGLLILGESSIVYMNDSYPDIIQSLDESAVFLTWAQIDAQRWLLADEYGRLYFLMLILNKHNVVTKLKLDIIGITSRASVLVYLDSGLVFVGAQHGDSQVILIEDGSFRVVTVISSISPVLDLAIMDMGNRESGGQINEYSSGQARIVTGSGAFRDGSLRSLRSGVSMEELGSFEGIGFSMASMKNLFSLRSISSNQYDDLLIMSFIEESRIFQFSPEGEIEEKDEFKSMIMSQATLFTLNLQNDRVLQVCEYLVRVIDLESEMIISEWSPPPPETKKMITAASANLRYLAIVVGGIEAKILDLDDDLCVVATRTFIQQVSCIHVPMFSNAICIAGFWDQRSVFLMDLHCLSTIQESVVSNDSAFTPRSILLTHILPDSSPTLLVAMANGEVVTFSVDLNSSSLSISEKKVVVLGTQPATLSILPRSDGYSSVFAACEHPSLIYASEGRIVYSAVRAEKVTSLCSFNSEAFPGAIAFATAKDFGIALLGTERITDIQTLHVQETVRRITYSANLKVFGLGTVGRSLQDGIDVPQSQFKLVDEIKFNELDTYSLHKDELVESVITATLTDLGSTNEQFVVGTGYLEDQSDETRRGRIILFTVTEDRKLRLTTTIDVLGACRALGVVAGRIVAGLFKTVVIYSLWQNKLQKMCSYRCATAPIDLSVENDLIAVADIMKSVSIIKFIPGTKGASGSLEEVARHFQTVWTTAIAFIEKDTVLEADAEGNLLILTQNTSGVTPEDRRRLDVTSEIRLGEMVNRIRKFDVPISSNAAVAPKAFLGTVHGSIYLYANILPAAQDLLMRLQAALASLIPSLGDIPFNAYRGFSSPTRTEDEPFRFVDGELVDKFLDLSTEEQKNVLLELPSEQRDLDEVRAIVEGLRRLR